MAYAGGEAPRKGERIEVAKGCGYLRVGWHDVRCDMPGPHPILRALNSAQPEFTSTATLLPPTLLVAGENYRARVEWSKGFSVWRDGEWFCAKDSSNENIIIDWTKVQEFDKLVKQQSLPLSVPVVSELWSVEEGNAKHRLYSLKEAEQASSKTDESALDRHS